MAVITTLDGERFHLTTVRISERAYNLSKDGKLSRSALLEKAIMDVCNQTKTCSKCKEILPISEFTKDKTHRDGLRCECRSCRKESRGRV